LLVEYGDKTTETFDRLKVSIVFLRSGEKVQVSGSAVFP
jgi:hypothetical protein